jgi:hypothetical protein
LGAAEMPTSTEIMLASSAAPLAYTGWLGRWPVVAELLAFG